MNKFLSFFFNFFSFSLFQIVRKSIGMPLWLRGIMVNIMNIMGEKRASDVLRAGYPCEFV